MTLYTALGRYEMKANPAGEKRPHITAGGRTYELDMWEMIAWSSLIWNIYTFDEISREFYKKEREMHILGERDCESYLADLERMGLVACGHGVTGMDALRDLLDRLFVIPASANLFTKAAAFLHLTFLKGVPLKVTIRIFEPTKLSETEKQLIRFVKQNRLPVWLVCNQLGNENAYSDIASLYLNKHVIFDIE